MSIPETAPDLYEILGIPRDATPEEIKRAYRSASKRAHPDTGGSVEAFAKVQHAWNILGDPERRARYDNTGDQTEQPADNRDAKIHAFIMGAIDRSLDARDVVEAAIRHLDQDWARGREANDKLLSEKAKVEKVRKRLKFKGGGVDLIDRTLAERLASIERNIENNEGVMALLAEAMEKLESGWDYDAEPVPEQPKWSAFDHEYIFREAIRKNPLFTVNPGS